MCTFMFKIITGDINKPTVWASDQSIIDPRDIPMQILLVAGLKIALFTSKHSVTNFMSVHRRVLTNDRCVFALSFSSRPFTSARARNS